MDDKDERPIPPSAPDDDGARFCDANDRLLSEEERRAAQEAVGAAENVTNGSKVRSRGSRGSLSSDTSEDDPRQVGMENGIFGDYDMKRSPSTKAFLLSYIDDEMARRNLPGRLSSIANESLTAKKRKKKKRLERMAESQDGSTGLQRHSSSGGGGGDDDLDDNTYADADADDENSTDNNNLTIGTPTNNEAIGTPKRHSASLEPAESLSKTAGAGPPTSIPKFGDETDDSRGENNLSHVEIAYEAQTSSQDDHKINAKRQFEHLRAMEGSPSLAQQVFRATGEVYMEGVESIVDDNFWKCFQSNKPAAWNWNAYLWPLWAIGVLFRYFVLFPIRLLIFAAGWIMFGVGMVAVQGFLPRGDRRTRLEHKLISMMCGVFCITWGAVIRYHGSPVEPLKGTPHPVYVANHSSMIDVIILQQMRCFSLVGQRHKGIVRFLQEVVLGCLQCVWFDRGEIKDRETVARKLREHAQDPNMNPLLVFPEGTCVNNEYIIQFKKGIFEIGVPVLPVAIKYNKMFVDPFWNSRKQSFPMHLVELMTSWCLICEVWYLKPHVRREGESAQDFAARVKKAIADKAGLKNVNWDGYMKYWKPSERYLRARQALFAKSLRKIHQESIAREERLKKQELARQKLLFTVPSFGAIATHKISSPDITAGGGIRRRASSISRSPTV